MNRQKEIKYHYDKAFELCLDEIRYLVKDILTKHPKLDHFTMGMGSYFFSDKYGPLYSENVKYFNPINNLMEDWGYDLKVTGFPMMIVRDKVAKGEFIELNNW